MQIELKYISRVDATMYRSLIEFLFHTINTRPNICNAINIVSEYMNSF